MLHTVTKLGNNINSLKHKIFIFYYYFKLYTNYTFSRAGKYCYFLLQRPTNPHVNQPNIDKFCLWLMEYNNRSSYLVQVPNSYFSAGLCLMTSCPVTEVAAININCIRTFNNDAQRTNIYHKFLYTYMHTCVSNKELCG